jgi:predicted esterase
MKISRHAAYAIAGAAALVAVAILVLRRHAVARLWSPALAPRADWCPDGFEALEGDACLAAPARARGDVELIVYLHGMYAPGPGAQDEDDRRRRLARAANAHGFSVLALRGRRGQCSAEDKRDHFCWPSNERNAGDGPAFAARMAGAMGVAEAKLGAAKRRYLLGFSNGGYFAGLVATRALVAFDAVVIAGAGPVEPVRAEGAKPPMLLLTGDEDGAVESMMRLDVELGRAGWPHTIASRDGGHALTDADIRLALTFLERTRREPLPLRPPLATRPPRPHVARGGGEAHGAPAAAAAEPTASPTGSQGD